MSERDWFEKEMKIREAMTRVPGSVSREASIFEARRRMKRHQVGYIPVMDGDELVGVISGRDIDMAEIFHGPGYLRVGDAMTDVPFVVHPDQPLSDVLSTMIEQEHVIALVVGPNGHAVGSFTPRDALAMLKAIVLLGERERAQESDLAPSDALAKAA